jgi:hypothetical protein
MATCKKSAATQTGGVSLAEVSYASKPTAFTGDGTPPNISQCAVLLTRGLKDDGNEAANQEFCLCERSWDTRLRCELVLDHLCVPRIPPTCMPRCADARTTGLSGALGWL